MPGSSGNSSFIPKRGTSKHKRKIHKGKVYSLTIISYVLLFAALTASAAVYVYGGVVRAELENEAKAMNEAIGFFKESDMKRVQEFDKRLRQAHQRLNNSVSITSIFDAIEKATIDTVRFDKLSLSRNLDDGFVVQASIETDTFDSSIFQRELYKAGAPVRVLEIEDLQITEDISDEGRAVGQTVYFKALMAIPLSAVLYQGTPLETTDENVLPPTTSNEPVLEEEVGGESAAEIGEEVSDNQTDV